MEWAGRELRVPVGPLYERRYFLPAHCVRIGADVSRGKHRCWIDTSSRGNGEQQEWNSSCNLGSHVGRHDGRAGHDQQHDLDMVDHDNDADNDNDDADNNDA